MDTNDALITKSMIPKGYTTNAPPTTRPVRIYVHGVFDLFHIGHTRFLEKAKRAFANTHLIVGVTEDNDTEKAKGLTVMSGAERSEVVRACKWVDQVIQDCPPVLLPDFFEEYNIDYFAHDDDYRLPPGREDPYAFIKREGRFLVIPRTTGIDTTSIVTRIVRDPARYKARLIRSGVSPEELGVSKLDPV